LKERLQKIVQQILLGSFKFLQGLPIALEVGVSFRLPPDIQVSPSKNGYLSMTIFGASQRTWKTG
jgi:hypothetical protein